MEVSELQRRPNGTLLILDNISNVRLHTRLSCSGSDLRSLEHKNENQDKGRNYASDKHNRNVKSSFPRASC